MDAELLKLALAHAVVASCAVYGDSPEVALRGRSIQRRAILPAAIGASQATGLPVARLAAMLGASPAKAAEALTRPGASQKPAIAAAAKAVRALIGEPPVPPPEPPSPVAASAPAEPPPVEAVGLAVEVRAKRDAAERRAGARERTERARPRGAATVATTVATGPGLVRLKALTPQKLRYAGWFVEADWTIEDTAGLFDLDPEHLADALEASARGSQPLAAAA